MDTYVRTITINKTGSVTGKVYKGQFKVKLHLSAIELMEADEYRRMLLGPQPENALDATKKLAFGAGQLAVRIVDAPQWWNSDETGLGGEKMIDLNIPQAILEAIQEELRAYQENLQKDTEKAIKRVRSKIQNENKSEQEEDDSED
jgi:hypothetical protein